MEGNSGGEAGASVAAAAAAAMPDEASLSEGSREEEKSSRCRCCERYSELLEAAVWLFCSHVSLKQPTQSNSN